jgi:hypothetical protein
MLPANHIESDIRTWLYACNSMLILLLSFISVTFEYIWVRFQVITVTSMKMTVFWDIISKMLVVW